MVGPQPAKMNMAEAGDHVVVDHPRVPVRGRRCERASLARKPVLDQEPAQRRASPRRQRGTRRQVALELPRQVLGVVTARAGGVPAATFPPADGVDAVVGNDVEAVTAVHDVGHRPPWRSPPPVDKPGERRGPPLAAWVRSHDANPTSGGRRPARWTEESDLHGR